MLGSRKGIEADSSQRLGGRGGERRPFVHLGVRLGFACLLPKLHSHLTPGEDGVDLGKPRRSQCWGSRRQESGLEPEDRAVV